VGLFADIVGRRELLEMLVARNLKIRYKNSALGFLWSLLAPLFLILIYAVFLRVLRFNVDLRLLVTGIVAWQFLALCLGDSLGAIVGNANLVTKAAFPRIVLPLSTVGANLVNFVLSFVVVMVYLLIAGAPFPAVWLLPFAVLTQFALCLGVSMLVSCANVFFRDTEHLVSVIMLAWFFLTPVIYPVDLVMGNTAFPAWWKALYFVNPMTGIVTVYRMALVGVPNPGTMLLWVSCASAWMILVVGVTVFREHDWRFGDEL